MVECVRCGAEFSSEQLFDVIYEKELAKICESCAYEAGVPIIRKPTTFQLKVAETPSTVYERLSRMAKLNPIEHKEKFSTPGAGRIMLPLKKPEPTLREIVDKKLGFKPGPSERTRDDLVDNFHWVIMRARRAKKLSQEQVGKEIAESRSAIETLERGDIPPESDRVINKLESFLRIKLKKNSPEPISRSEMITERPAIKNLSFDPASAKELKIGDLKGMKPEIEVEDEEMIDLSEEPESELEESGSQKEKDKYDIYE
jgi:ribosome-binding protein aMBF1 (putative translation factor)